VRARPDGGGGVQGVRHGHHARDTTTLELRQGGFGKITQPWFTAAIVAPPRRLLALAWQVSDLRRTATKD
jgi:hypothetical protein